MKKSVTRIAVAAAFGIAATAALAGEITLYENPGFQGRRMTLRGTTPDLDRTNFNDRAESIVVREGAVGLEHHVRDPRLRTALPRPERSCWRW